MTLDFGVFMSRAWGEVLGFGKYNMVMCVFICFMSAWEEKVKSKRAGGREGVSKRNGSPLGSFSTPAFMYISHWNDRESFM